MLARVALLLLAFQSSWITPLAPPATASDELRVKLGARVHSYKLTASNLVEALTQVAREFQIPMGIAWVNTPAARDKLALSWKDATVQEILEAIAKTQPGYEVQIGNGIVHVFSSKLVPDRQNFLRLRIRAFEVHEEATEVASRKLRDLAKVIVSPPRRQSGLGGIAGSLAANLDDPKVSVRLKNVSVEDVLDALAVSSPRKIWIVTFSDAPTLTPTGFRRTLTLWNNFPIPDNEQPIWDMAHWGDAIPVAVLGRK